MFILLYIVVSALNFQITSCTSIREGFAPKVPCVCSWHVFLFSNGFCLSPLQISLFLQVSDAEIWCHGNVDDSHFTELFTFSSW